jgi:ubiquinone/menaquinone biosynthesis C-methylase UbiE
VNFDITWEKTHSERQWGIEPEPQVIEFAEHNIPFGSKILDLGTGAGAQAFGLAKLGFEVEGLDVSESAIKRCLERKTNEKINFTVGDVINLPYQDNLFDAAVDCVVFQHLSLEDLEKALGEVLRILRPGGLFLSLAATDDYDLTLPSPAPVRPITANQIVQFYHSFEYLSFTKTSHPSRWGTIVSWWQIETKKSLV